MPFIKRDLLPLLQSHRPPKACVLFGPRRTGKTTLLRELSRQQNVSWFNGDNSLEVAQNLDLPTGAAIRSLLMNSKTIVIDEAQRIPGIGLLLKRLVDENEQLENPVNIFATRCIELGFDVKTLSELLGHSSVNITLNRYVHSSMDTKKTNMQRLTL